MRRIVGLVIAGGLSLGLATAASAQSSLMSGGMFGGGGSFSGLPQTYGYNPVYGGMNGYYPTGAGLGFSSATSSLLRGGYGGYASPAPRVYSSGYSGVGVGPYFPYSTGFAAPALSPTTSVYSSAYSGLVPGVTNRYLPYPTTVTYPAYGASPYIYSAYPTYYGGYGFRRGLFGGLRSRAYLW
jgi:hypothetical protein